VSGRVFDLRRVRVGLALVTLVVGLALVGPLLAPRGATEYVGLPNSRRAAGALLGTDYLGQDVWSRFLLGGRAILIYAALATIFGVTAGAAVGLVAAYRPGILDDALMRAVDVLLAVPQLLLVLVAMTSVGPEPWLIIGTIALVTVPRVARVMRGAAVSVVERDFVRVSEALGEPTWRILRADVLPNVSGPLLVEASIRFTFAIGIVASLAFLGFTPTVNAANWAVMVQENRAALSVQPWGVLLPAAAIAVLVLGTGLIADGIARVSAGAGRAFAGER
jgi:peptide/nickel transport system permease protein